MTEATATGSAASRTDYVAAQLRQAIVRHDLEPGERLHQAELCARFGVSQTPMREALARLAGEGWVVTYPQRGARVSELTLAQMTDLYDVRAQLEPEALRRAVETGGAQWLADVTAAYDAMVAVAGDRPAELAGLAYDQYEVCHVEFHKVLLANCGSGWLIRFTDALIEQSGRFRRLAWEMRAVRNRSVAEEHAAIHAAVLAGDADLAARLVHEHSELTRVSLEGWMRDQG